MSIPSLTLVCTVEWICRTTSAMARAEYGYTAWLLLHSRECGFTRNVCAGFGRTRMCRLEELLAYLILGRADGIRLSDRVRRGCTIVLHSDCGCKL